MEAEILQLAQGLGITESQLERLQRKYRYEHGEEAEEKLLAWLRSAQREHRDRKWLLSRRSVPAYTESPSEAMTDAGEAPPPDEVATYRHSRQAQARYSQEREQQVADLFGACEEVRSAVDGLDAEIKKSISRDLFVLKGKLDRLEQKLRRRIAA